MSLTAYNRLQNLEEAMDILLDTLIKASGRPVSSTELIAILQVYKTTCKDARIEILEGNIK